MPIEITLKDDFTLDGNHIISITEYSRVKLVVLVPNAIAPLNIKFNWVSPNNTKFEERPMYLDAENSTETHTAYYGNIYLSMTAGLTSHQETGMARLAFRADELYSPILKINVNKSILPDILDYPPSALEDLTQAFNNLMLGVFTEQGVINSGESIQCSEFAGSSLVSVFVSIPNRNSTFFFHPEDMFDGAVIEHIVQVSPQIKATIVKTNDEALFTISSGTATAKFRSFGG